MRSVTTGALSGLAFAFLSVPAVYAVADSPAGRAVLILSLFWAGLVVGTSTALNMKVEASERSAEKSASEKKTLPPTEGPLPKVCDTSVLIDGRIVDICRIGFIEGEIIIPTFILHELQGIADSSESLKRNRGRRGLDVVNKLKDIPEANIRILNTDYPDESEVDHKLIRVTQELDGVLVTNDFNLNKVARARSVRVLNLNDLVNALKTIYLPGEEIRVSISREGKEPGQGVAYLDDGTMVVVDNAVDFIGKTIDVVVTNIHQTTAGRMIFTRYDGPSRKPSSSGGGPRS
ncbi:MAG: TRAM domain-containing protein [Candidatus Hydrogenedentota bacterium]|nr:MAG: TRAM domain-containing protein [Candidatus Hydrogenedentota bacterium]